MSNKHLLNDEYWSNRYQNLQAGWDIGYPSTPLKEYIDQLKDKSIHILIPGCGNAYEAAYLLQMGFIHITTIDIASELVKRLQEKFAGQQIRVLHENFFNHIGTYNLILEQTFFCALDPSLREVYVNKMAELLKPGGKLVGLLFNKHFESGPPFGGDKKEYEQLFNGKLQIKKMELCYNSILPRKDAELFFIAEKQQG